MTAAPGAGGNLSELVREAGSRFGSRRAIIGDGPDRSWGELDAAADAGAADLLESGTRRGDRVLIALPTSADLAAVLIAVARAGLVAVPMDPERADPQRVADLVGARAEVLGRRAPAAGTGIRIGAEDLAGWWTGRRAPVSAIGGGEDLALLARASRNYRAVMIPHRAVLAAVDGVLGAPGLGLRPDDRALLALPLHHLAGLVTAFLPLAPVGGAAVIPDQDGGPGALAAAIHRHRVTVLPGSPAIYRQLLATPGLERALATVRLMTSGAAPLSPEDFSALRVLTGQTVWEGYGISESTSVVASSLTTRHSRAGSVGMALPGVELRVDVTGADTNDTADTAGGVEGDDDEPLGDAPDRTVDVTEQAATEEAVTSGTATSDPAPGDDDGAAVDVEHAAADGPVIDDVTAVDFGVDDASIDPADSADPVPEAQKRGPARDSAPARPRPDTLAEVDGIGDVGRISLRGRTLFLGYWPDAADGPGGDGWFRTADVGYLDDFGELHLVDRADDTFVVAGFTVYPREVERVLADHPDVAEAVVGGMVELTGTRVVAVIVPAVGTAPTAEDLAEYVAQRLPAFKRPTEFAVRESLPRTELGRIDRSAALAGFGPREPVETTRPIGTAGPVGTSGPGHPDTAGPMPTDDVAADAEPATDLAPEAAAGLDELGRRLPAAGSRRGRSTQDSDEDLFGDDWG